MAKNNMVGAVPAGNGWNGQPSLDPMGNPLNPGMQTPVQGMAPKKSKLGLWLGLGIGGVMLVVAAVVAVMMLTKVDYSESYKVAKELKTKISSLTSNYSCTRVIDAVSSASTSEQSYQKYADECREMGDGVDELVEKLGQTPGVKRNKEIQAQFERFQEAINAVLPNRDELEQRLKLYETWHKFVVLVDNLSASKSSDAEIQSAARVLTSSGNQILATYGEGWLEKTLAYVQAYRAYYNASYSDSNKSTLRTVMNDRSTEQKNWVAENKPDIAELGGLSFANASKVGSEFTKLYDLITDAYEQNYNEESGDCLEFLGEVFCD